MTIDKMTERLSDQHESQLIALGKALVDQDAARVIVPPQKNASGFWFGGGNVTKGSDGRWYLIGRYRNHGDSRTGLHAGERGLELAIFTSSDQGTTWTKELSFSKRQLNVGDREVLSIEGSALHWTDDGVELYVSTEKTNIGYPPTLEAHLKPGTGVWTIDRIASTNIDSLANGEVETVLQATDPQYIHVKDPFVYSMDDQMMLFYCTHPFSWSSSNTAYVTRRRGSNEFSPPDYTFFPRGTTWDVAMTRGTAVATVPQVGEFTDISVSLIFYDGGECLRNLDEHVSAVKRPRGYSCEELGGLAYILNHDFNNIHRLSVNQPLFVSPHGTGCSRYVDVFVEDRAMIATWKQSQDDLSQPLVMNQLTAAEVESILAR